MIGGAGKNSQTSVASHRCNVWLVANVILEHTGYALTLAPTSPSPLEGNGGVGGEGGQCKDPSLCLAGGGAEGGQGGRGGGLLFVTSLSSSANDGPTERQNQQIGANYGASKSNFMTDRPKTKPF